MRSWVYPEDELSLLRIWSPLTRNDSTGIVWRGPGL